MKAKQQTNEEIKKRGKIRKKGKDDTTGEMLVHKLWVAWAFTFIRDVASDLNMSFLVGKAKMETWPVTGITVFIK